MKVHRRHDNGLRQAPDEAFVWRRRSLLEAGFPPALADTAAREGNLDLHAVLQLIDRGCPPELAVTILEPLPGEVTS